MKKILLFILLFISAATLSMAQVNTPFEKENFPDQKDAFKEAKKSYEEGKSIFLSGYKIYLSELDFFLSSHDYMPVSRHDYNHAGEAAFRAALKSLEAANTFNPNNADVNWMIAFCKFAINSQSDASLKYFEKAFQLNPNVFPEFTYYAGWAYQLQAKWDDALKYYNLYLTALKAQSKVAGYKLEDINKKIAECNTGKELMAKPKRVRINNLGDGVNSSFPDYSAYITTDESMVVFTSRRDNSTGQKLDPFSGGYYEDLYLSNKVDKKWGPAQNLGAPINTPGHDATAGLSNDGTTLYIYENQKGDGGDLYESVLKGTAWKIPEHMNKNINTKAHESTISESFDNKYVYFISDREKGIGARDIYYCTKDAKNNWVNPTNVGTTINTKYDEEGVFMHPDGITMYFSSQGHGSMGGYDIFKSTYTDGKWSAPENLGWPINGPDDDVFFVVAGNGRRGYYSSAREGGFGDKDIYSITFLGDDKPFLLSNEDNLIASITAPVKTIQPAPPLELQQPSLTILKGTITDEITKQPLEATIELNDLDKNELIATFKSNSATGKYLVTLPDGHNYGIAVTAPGYLFHSENFNIPKTNGFQEIIKDVELKRVAVGNKIILKNIFFDFDKSTLRPQSINELERLLKFLNDNPTVKIEIGGHTDSYGSDEYNIRLSQSRCESVVKYLIEHGIAKDRLKAHGYGEKVPIDTNETPEGRQMNRRTEFEIIGN